MKQDVDVSSGDTELARDIFTGALLQEPERDDGALRSAEAFDARAEANVLFRFGEELLGVGVGGETKGGVELRVRSRDVMTTSAIARGVLGDGGDIRQPFLARRRRVAAMDELQMLRERFLSAFDGVFWRQPFPSCRAHDGDPVFANEIGEGIEDVHRLPCVRRGLPPA